MAIRIKNERIHAMAKELAALTGGSQVAAISEALQEKLTRLEAEKEVAPVQAAPPLKDNVLSERQ